MFQGPQQRSQSIPVNRRKQSCWRLNCYRVLSFYIYLLISHQLLFWQHHSLVGYILTNLNLQILVKFLCLPPTKLCDKRMLLICLSRINEQLFNTHFYFNKWLHKHVQNSFKFLCWLFPGIHLLSKWSLELKSIIRNQFCKN